MKRHSGPLHCYWYSTIYNQHSLSITDVLAVQVFLCWPGPNICRSLGWGAMPVIPSFLQPLTCGSYFPLCADCSIRQKEVGALRHFLSDFRQDCHQSWWKFRWIAWIGEKWGDKIVTKFGDTLGDDFVTYCFTQYGDFFGELPEMVRIEVTKMSPNLVTILVTILSLFISPIMVIFGGICQNWW